MEYTTDGYPWVDLLIPRELFDAISALMLEKSVISAVRTAIPPTRLVKREPAFHFDRFLHFRYYGHRARYHLLRGPITSINRMGVDTRGHHFCGRKESPRYSGFLGAFLFFLFSSFGSSDACNWH